MFLCPFLFFELCFSQDFSWATDVGSYSTDFNFSDTQTPYRDNYGYPAYNLCYRLTLNSKMDISVYAMSSGDLIGVDIYVLDQLGGLICSTEQNDPSNSDLSSLSLKELSSGIYYIILEKQLSRVGAISVDISGSSVESSTSIVVNLGTKLSSFVYSDIQNTANSTNSYSGCSTNDVRYNFILNLPMEVVISHCGSAVSDTYVLY